MKKQGLSLLLATVMTCGLLAGCNSSKSSDSTTASSITSETAADGTVDLGDKDITLIFSVWDATQGDTMKLVGEAFTKIHPNVTIDVQVTSWGEYFTKLEAGAVANALPDIFWMHTNEVYKYIANNLLVEIDDSIADLSKFPAHSLAIYEDGGKYYGIPKDFDTIGLYYNKEIFDDAGVAYPDETWTWDTLLEVAQKLHNPDEGIYGIATPYEAQAGFYSLVYQNGGAIIKEDHTSGFDMIETQEAIEFYFDMTTKHNISPDLNYFAENGNDSLFTSGNAAMMINGSWKMITYSQNDVIADVFDVAVLPKGKERGTISNSLAISGSAKSQHPEAVVEFLKFVATEDAQIIMGQHGTAIPAYEGTQVYWDERLSDYNAYVFTEMLDYAYEVPVSPTRAQWTEVINLTLQSYAIGDMTAEEAFTYITEQMNAILATEE